VQIFSSVAVKNLNYNSTSNVLFDFILAEQEQKQKQEQEQELKD
jgi:hypothetical protein